MPIKTFCTFRNRKPQFSSNLRRLRQEKEAHRSRERIRHKMARNTPTKEIIVAKRSCSEKLNNKINYRRYHQLKAPGPDGLLHHLKPSEPPGAETAQDRGDVSGLQETSPHTPLHPQQHCACSGQLQLPRCLRLPDLKVQQRLFLLSGQEVPPELLMPFSTSTVQSVLSITVWLETDRRPRTSRTAEISGGPANGQETCL